MLALYVVLVYFLAHSAAGATFFGNLPVFATFTTNWLVDQSHHTIFLFSWSLAAEEQFYIIWPLIESLVSAPLLKFMLLAMVAVTSQIASWHTNFGGAGSLPMRMLSDVPLGITLGTILAHVLNDKRSFAIAYRLLGTEVAHSDASPRRFLR